MLTQKNLLLQQVLLYGRRRMFLLELILLLPLNVIEHVMTIVVMGPEKVKLIVVQYEVMDIKEIALENAIILCIKICL